MINLIMWVIAISALIYLTIRVRNLKYTVANFCQVIQVKEKEVVNVKGRLLDAQDKLSDLVSKTDISKTTQSRTSWRDTSSKPSHRRIFDDYDKLMGSSSASYSDDSSHSNNSRCSGGYDSSSSSSDSSSSSCSGSSSSND